MREGGDHYEEITQRLIDRLLQEQRDLEARREAIDRELERVQRDIIALRTTLEIYRRFAHLPPKDMEEELAQELGSLTQLQSLVLLAQRNGGIVRTKEAARLLLRVGKISNPRNAYNIVQHLLSDSGRFERVAAGVYQLLISEKGSTELGGNQSHTSERRSSQLGHFLLNSLSEKGKTLTALKEEVQREGFSYPEKSLGRVIHCALVGMAQRGLVERVEGVWRLKPK